MMASNLRKSAIMRIPRCASGFNSMSHAAHAAAALAHTAARCAAGKFLGLVAGMGRRHAERLRQMLLAAEGQTGFSSPRIKSSKSLPQSLQVYS